VSAVDSYPKRFDVRCPDGALRHDGHFDTRDEAVRFAEWGHCCVAGIDHEIVTLVEVSPGATLPLDEAERYVELRARDAERELHEIALLHSVGYSLIVLFDGETYSTRRIGQVSPENVDVREHDSLGAALQHCSNEVLAELEANDCGSIERLQLVTSLIGGRSTLVVD